MNAFVPATVVALVCLFFAPQACHQLAAAKPPQRVADMYVARRAPEGRHLAEVSIHTCCLSSCLSRHAAKSRLHLGHTPSLCVKRSAVAHEEYELSGGVAACVRNCACESSAVG